MRVVRGKLLLQRGAGAVHLVPGQLDLVSGHKRERSRDLRMRRRLHVVRHWRQPRVHVRCRVCCDRDELFAVQRRLLLACRRIVDVLAVRGRRIFLRARCDFVHSLHERPVDHVRRLVLMRRVRRRLLFGRHDVYKVPGQLGLLGRQPCEQLRLLPWLCLVGLGQLAHVLLRARHVPERDVVELLCVPRRVLLVDL